MKYIILFLLSASTILGVNAQTAEPNVDDYVIIYPFEGKKIVGVVLSINENSLEIESEEGTITVNKSEIKEIYSGPEESIINNQVYKNRSDSYFFFPSARPIGEGESYYKNYFVFFNQFNFALGDNFSFNTGFEALSLLFNDWPRVLYLAPKYSIGSDKNYVGVGMSIFITEDDGSAAFNSLAFVNYTLGSEDTNLTFGVSYVFSINESPLIFNIDAVFPLGKNVNFIAELLRTNDGSIVGGGGLRVKQKGVSLDLGFFRPAIFGGIATPFFGVSIPL